MRHLTAVLEEVSILSPGVVPAHRGAKVIRITERGTALDRMRERQRAEAKPQPPQPVGEVFYGGPIIRRNAGQILAVR